MLKIVGIVIYVVENTGFKHSPTYISGEGPIIAHALSQNVRPVNNPIGSHVALDVGENPGLLFQCCWNAVQEVVHGNGIKLFCSGERLQDVGLDSARI
ncbi:hypothetical protein N7495_001738 [Penicillium taxi]|uniref:uncharacterized protein n=1 Tax=Penicillium taxi TaxID=168475 RepID=UPI0025453D61|nr:uncharacterized protein N7495_001738 [Penicillium taxi]KAJ5909056.1 hypothetical protein N7495_001738 [Penicillium taxi]